MFNWLIKKYTKNYNSIPLFWIEFNLNKYREEGEKGSCLLHAHPDFKDDQYITDTFIDLVDYIRSNYDMEQFTKI